MLGLLVSVLRGRVALWTSEFSRSAVGVVCELRRRDTIHAVLVVHGASLEGCLAPPNSSRDEMLWPSIFNEPIGSFVGRVAGRTM